MEKIWKYLRTCLFLTASILIFIFANSFVKNNGKNINLYVGLVMLFFGLESIVIVLAKKEAKKEQVKLLNGLINVLLGIIMIFFVEGNALELRIGCSIWSIWSITREAEDICENVLEEIKKHPITSLINFAESIVVVVFSVGLLICAENEIVEEALKHVYLLGVEFLIEAINPFVKKFEANIYKK